MSDSMIRREPTYETIDRIVHNNAEVVEPKRDDDGYVPYKRLTVKLDLAVDSLLVTLDEDEIAEKGLRVRTDSGKYDYGRPRRAPWTYNSEFSDEMYERSPVAFDELVDTELDHCVRELREIIEKGFVTEPVYGRRTEYREPSEPTVSMYQEEYEAPSQDFETVERSYEVGTKRYSVVGVFDS